MDNQVDESGSDGGDDVMPGTNVGVHGSLSEEVSNGAPGSQSPNAALRDVHANGNRVAAEPAAEPAPEPATQEVPRRVQPQLRPQPRPQPRTQLQPRPTKDTNGADTWTRSATSSSEAMRTLRGLDGQDRDGRSLRNQSHRTGSVIVSGLTSASERKRMHSELKRQAAAAHANDPPEPNQRNACLELWDKLVILPWNPWYKAWRTVTVVAAIFTVFFETYLIAFPPAGFRPFSEGTAIVEYLLISIFVMDILIRFHVAYFDEHDDMIVDRRKIAINYRHNMLFVDIISILPFYVTLLSITGEIHKKGEARDSDMAHWLSLVRLIRLIRFYRVREIFHSLKYNTRISLIWLTLIRNFFVALMWSHSAACTMYYIARRYDFDPDQTWIGPSLMDEDDVSDFERYMTALYWSIVTFTTVGYGDYSPVNVIEQIWGMIYMLLNIIVNSWIIGSITLLIVKNDEKTGNFRESLFELNRYANLHDLQPAFHKRLKTQLYLEFKNQELSDENVLSNFPDEVRRKVLRRLYVPYLTCTQLMDGMRRQFMDEFLSACRVEIFSPGEELLMRGKTASDLYLLVDGIVRVMPWISNTRTASESDGIGGANTYHGTSSIADTVEYGGVPGHGATNADEEIYDGNFINEIGFFTATPEVDTVRTKTVCKTLSISRTAYKMLAQDHPSSAGKILENLLRKVEDLITALQDKEDASEASSDPTAAKRLHFVRAGSVFDQNLMKMVDDHDDRRQTVATAHARAALTGVQNLVRMHKNKQKDDHTTRFLFAASRSDTDTITLMCNQGFDPNSADYDFRTALMVASMKGNQEAVEKLLEFHANPNLTDMHGTSALYEATRNGHDKIMRILLNAGGKLCMSDAKSASILCAAVFNGDIVRLRSLLTARMNVNASDYDKRAAVHVAAAEGNLTALKVLVEFDADLEVVDRWGNNVMDEAKSAGAAHVIKYLQEMEGRDGAPADESNEETDAQHQ